MEIRDLTLTRMNLPWLRLGFSCRNIHFYLGIVCITLFFGACNIGAAATNAKHNESSSDNKSPENPVPQVRYRTRPVAAFQSGPKRTNKNNSTTNSSEIDSSERSGAPFIAVHDLTSQTFEKLQENWKNVEAFIRNLQARRSQEESLRSSSSSSGGDRDSRPPYNNVYTLKYHPVVLQGEGSSSVDDIIGGSNARGAPPRTFNGISFNPFPFDPKGEGSKNVDMERHTVATIYTIGICLTIMAIGSVMFILINKCDGSGGSHYASTSAGNRLTRSVMGVARGGRTNNISSNGRSRNSRGGRISNENTQTATSSGNTHASGSAENIAKRLSDLPPSYDSLFPEGGPKAQAIPELASTSNAANVDPVIHDSTNNSNIKINEVATPPGASNSES